GHVSSATTSRSAISILPRPFASPERTASLESPGWILFLPQMSGAGSLQCAACKSSRSLDEGLDEQQPLETGLAKRHNESGRTCGRSLYKADASLASCPPPMTP